MPQVYEYMISEYSVLTNGYSAVHHGGGNLWLETRRYRKRRGSGIASARPISKAIALPISEAVARPISKLVAHPIIKPHARPRQRKLSISAQRYRYADV